MYLLRDEELASLADHTWCIKRIRFFMTFGQSYLTHLECLENVGMTSIEPIMYEGREIIPLVGPSSILLALMASGLSGQSFAFNGYLPKDKVERIKKLKDLEKRSVNEKQTQIFMEAPYRNQNLLADVLQNCHPQTLLSVAVDLMNPTQFIKTQSIREWKTTAIDINKKPALFLLQAFI